ncbi:proline rich transmembrane protein 1B-like isoform X1 [Odocoileus virginianus]|uniref:Proline rich transmembrane protein 1B-like isoform X1 n=2 Tax=Odocoileus virginianus TaxID=9874 RepID=A0ABM4H7U5_ODOVR
MEETHGVASMPRLSDQRASISMCPPARKLSTMSKSRFGHGKKTLDTFFWINEVTGEITYPQKTDARLTSPAPLQKPEEGPRSQRGALQGAPPSTQDVASTLAQNASPPPAPKAALKDVGSRNSFPAPPPYLPAKDGAPSPLPFSAVPVTISPPGGALPPFSPLGPALLPQASAFPPSPSAPWGFTCKLKNILSGNNRFSF